jgi:hypothetical protein
MKKRAGCHWRLTMSATGGLPTSGNRRLKRTGGQAASAPGRS